MSQEPLVNGHYKCEFSEDHAEMLGENNFNTKEILRYARHLEHLKCLQEIKDKLLNAAIGKGWIDIETANRIIRNDRIILGGVITVLLFVIAYLLTGEKLDWLKLGR